MTSSRKRTGLFVTRKHTQSLSTRKKCVQYAHNRAATWHYETSFNQERNQKEYLVPQNSPWASKSIPEPWRWADTMGREQNYTVLWIWWWAAPERPGTVVKDHHMAVVASSNMVVVGLEGRANHHHRRVVLPLAWANQVWIPSLQVAIRHHKHFQPSTVANHHHKVEAVAMRASVCVCPSLRLDFFLKSLTGEACRLWDRSSLKTRRSLSFYSALLVFHKSDFSVSSHCPSVTGE